MKKNYADKIPVMLIYTASGSLKVSRCFFSFALMKCKDYGIMNA